MCDIIKLDISNNILLKLSLQAHELDITLNQHILNLLNMAMDRIEKEDPIYQAIEEIGKKQ